MNIMSGPGLFPFPPPDATTGQPKTREAIRTSLISELQKRADSKEEKKDQTDRAGKIKDEILENLSKITDKYQPEGTVAPSFAKNNDWLTKAIQQLHLLDDELDGIHSEYISVEIQDEKG